MNDVRNEEFIQTQLCRYISENYPSVIFLSDLSGVRLSKGAARKIASLKSSRGIPDLIILSPQEEFHGLMIELKARDAKVIRQDGALYADEHLREQADVLIRLRSQGYAAFFASGMAAACDLVDAYFSSQPRLFDQATSEVTADNFSPLVWKPRYES